MRDSPVIRVGHLLLLGLFAGLACAGPERHEPPATVVEPPHDESASTPPAPVSPAPPVPTPEAGFFYHGIYPGGRSGHEDDITAADVDAYERAVGKKAVWIYFSHNWFRGRAFPLRTARWIRARGSTPFIRLMLRSSAAENRNEGVFTLTALAEGAFDKDLAAWGDAAREFGSPLLVEWGTEMNGEWFPWNGGRNGGPRTGPERFRAAYRHIVEAVRGAGATNVVWVFHVNAADNPADDWNRFENYYPGDDVVDWLGISAYAAVTPREPEWAPFRTMIDDTAQRLGALALRKPIYVLEFGAPAHHPRGDAARWADEALRDLLSGRWPAVRGFSWWNEHWENDDVPSHDTDMRVQAVPGLAAVFRARLASPRVLEHVLSTDTPTAEP